jgi:DNA-binding SARP family transcriptional activator
MDFQILGTLRVTDDHQHVVPLGGAKPAALLAMLLAPERETEAHRLLAAGARAAGTPQPAVAR